MSSFPPCSTSPPNAEIGRIRSSSAEENLADSGQTPKCRNAPIRRLTDFGQSPSHASSKTHIPAETIGIWFRMSHLALIEGWIELKLAYSGKIWPKMAKLGTNFGSLFQLQNTAAKVRPPISGSPPCYYFCWRALVTIAL